MSELERAKEVESMKESLADMLTNAHGLRRQNDKERARLTEMWEYYDCKKRALKAALELQEDHRYQYVQLDREVQAIKEAVHKAEKQLRDEDVRLRQSVSARQSELTTLRHRLEELQQQIEQRRSQRHEAQNDTAVQRKRFELRVRHLEEELQLLGEIATQRREQQQQQQTDDATTTGESPVVLRERYQMLQEDKAMHQALIAEEDLRHRLLVAWRERCKRLTLHLQARRRLYRLALDRLKGSPGHPALITSPSPTHTTTAIPPLLTITGPTPHSSSARPASSPPEPPHPHYPRSTLLPVRQPRDHPTQRGQDYQSLHPCASGYPKWSLRQGFRSVDGTAGAPMHIRAHQRFMGGMFDSPGESHYPALDTIRWRSMPKPGLGAPPAPLPVVPSLSPSPEFFSAVEDSEWAREPPTAAIALLSPPSPAASAPLQGSSVERFSAALEEMASLAPSPSTLREPPSLLSGAEGSNDPSAPSPSMRRDEAAEWAGWGEMSREVLVGEVERYDRLIGGLKAAEKYLATWKGKSEALEQSIRTLVNTLTTATATATIDTAAEPTPPPTSQPEPLLIRQTEQAEPSPLTRMPAPAPRAAEPPASPDASPSVRMSADDIAPQLQLSSSIYLPHGDTPMGADQQRRPSVRMEWPATPPASSSRLGLLDGQDSGAFLDAAESTGDPAVPHVGGMGAGKALAGSGKFQLLQEEVTEVDFDSPSPGVSARSSAEALSGPPPVAMPVKITTAAATGEARSAPSPLPSPIQAQTDKALAEVQGLAEALTVTERYFTQTAKPVPASSLMPPYKHQRRASDVAPATLPRSALLRREGGDTADAKLAGTATSLQRWFEYEESQRAAERHMDDLPSASSSIYLPPAEGRPSQMAPVMPPPTVQQPEPAQRQPEAAVHHVSQEVQPAVEAGRPTEEPAKTTTKSKGKKKGSKKAKKTDAPPIEAFQNGFDMPAFGDMSASAAAAAAAGGGFEHGGVDSSAAAFGEGFAASGADAFGGGFGQGFSSSFKGGGFDSSAFDQSFAQQGS